MTFSPSSLNGHFVVKSVPWNSLKLKRLSVILMSKYINQKLTSHWRSVDYFAIFSLNIHTSDQRYFFSNKSLTFQQKWPFSESVTEFTGDLASCVCAVLVEKVLAELHHRICVSCSACVGDASHKFLREQFGPKYLIFHSPVFWERPINDQKFGSDKPLQKYFLRESLQ